MYNTQYSMMTRSSRTTDKVVNGPTCALRRYIFRAQPEVGVVSSVALLYDAKMFATAYNTFVF